MTWLWLLVFALSLLALAVVSWVLHRRWQARRFSSEWWRDDARRTSQELPETVRWDWQAWKGRER